MSKKYIAAFRDEWLKDEQSVWRKWTARCTMYDVNCNLGTMRKSALTSHKKHKEAAQRRLTCVPINSLFQAPASPKPRAKPLVKSVMLVEYWSLTTGTLMHY